MCSQILRLYAGSSEHYTSPANTWTAASARQCHLPADQVCSVSELQIHLCWLHNLEKTDLRGACHESEFCSWSGLRVYGIDPLRRSLVPTCCICWMQMLLRISGSGVTPFTLQKQQQLINVFLDATSGNLSASQFTVLLVSSAFSARHRSLLQAPIVVRCTCSTSLQADSARSPAILLQSIACLVSHPQKIVQSVTIMLRTLSVVLEAPE